MSDILIRGMEMPKYTTKAEFGIDAAGNPLCMVYHEDGTEPDIYDVVPLPEGHGRLIDADAFLATIRPLCTEDAQAACTLETVKQLMVKRISSAPTVVPKEGGAWYG